MHNTITSKSHFSMPLITPEPTPQEIQLSFGLVTGLFMLVWFVSFEGAQYIFIDFFGFFGFFRKLKTLNCM